MKKAFITWWDRSVAVLRGPRGGGVVVSCCPLLTRANAIHTDVQWVPGWKRGR
jgi:hypothetical protein